MVDALDLGKRTVVFCYATGQYFGLQAALLRETPHDFASGVLESVTIK
jgi:hypothetical protein